MNTITIELCAEDRSRLDAIIAGLKQLTAAPAPAVETAPEVKPVAEDKPIEAPAEPTPVEPAPAPEVKPVALSEFQKAVTLVCAKGPAQKKAAKEVINKYAASVSGVPEDKRAEVMAELAKL